MDQLQFYKGPSTFPLQNNIISVGMQRCQKCGVELIELSVNLKNQFSCDKCTNQLQVLSFTEPDHQTLIHGALIDANKKVWYQYRQNEAVMYNNLTDDYSEEDQLKLQSNLIKFIKPYTNQDYAIVKCQDEDFVVSYRDLQQIDLLSENLQKFLSSEELRQMKYLPYFWQEQYQEIEFLDCISGTQIKCFAKLFFVLDSEDIQLVILQDQAQTLKYVKYESIFNSSFDNLNMKLFGVPMSQCFLQVPQFLKDKYLYDIEQIQQAKTLNSALKLEEKVLQSLLLNIVDILQQSVQSISASQSQYLGVYVHYLCIEFKVDSCIEFNGQIQRGNILTSLQRLIKVLNNQ